MPVVLVLSALAMAAVTVGSEHVTPVVSNVPLIVMDEQPVASRANRHVSQSVHCVVGRAPAVNESDQRGAGQTVAQQLPETHASPGAQATPPEPAHPPQLRGSLVVSEHMVESMTVSPSASWGQLMSGDSHVTTHVPDVHTSPSRHSSSQSLQFIRSESRSRHVPEQSVNPPGQAAMQAPS